VTHTYHIVRALLRDKTIAQNPVYLREKQGLLRSSLGSVMRLEPRVSTVLLTLGVVILVCAPFVFIRNVLVLSLFGGLLCSLAWMLPMVTLTGAGLRREREQETLDLLLTIPQSTETVLFAKARAWLDTILRLSLGVLFGYACLGASFYFVFATGANNTLSMVVLALLTAPLVIAHQAQEFALAMALGMYFGTIRAAPGMIAIFGLAACMIIRLSQFLLVLIWVLGFDPISAAVASFLSVFTGAPILFLYGSLLPVLLTLAVLFGVREVAVVLLFRAALDNLSRK